MGSDDTPGPGDDTPQLDDTHTDDLGDDNDVEQPLEGDAAGQGDADEEFKQMPADTLLDTAPSVDADDDRDDDEDATAPRLDAAEQDELVDENEVDSPWDGDAPAQQVEQEEADEEFIQMPAHPLLDPAPSQQLDDAPAAPAIKGRKRFLQEVVTLSDAWPSFGLYDRSAWHLSQLRKRVSVGDQSHSHRVLAVWGDGEDTSGHMLYSTQVLHCYARYRIVISLDVSPSLFVVDEFEGAVLFDTCADVVLATLQSLIAPMTVHTVTGSTTFAPQFWVSVIAQGACLPVHVGRCLLVHQFLLTPDRLPDLRHLVVSALFKLEPILQKRSSPTACAPELAIQLENAALTVKMLDPSACPVIIIVSDGVITPPDTSSYDNSFMQLCRHDFVCHVVQLSTTRLQGTGMALMADPDSLHTTMTRLHGSLFVTERAPDRRLVLREWQSRAPHKCLSSWSNLQRAMLCRLSRVSESDVATHGAQSPSRAMAPTVWIPLTDRVKICEYQVNVSVTELCYCRIKEGFQVVRGSTHKKDGETAVILLQLAWRRLLQVSYQLTAVRVPVVQSSPVSAKESRKHHFKRVVSVLVGVQGPSDLLLLLRNKASTSGGAAHEWPFISQLQSFVEQIKQVDKMLHRVARLPVPYVVNTGSPLPEAAAEVFSLLQQHSLADWHRWFVLDRFECWCHGNRDFDDPSVKVLQAQTKVINAIRSWATFSLSDYVYVKNLHVDTTDEPDQHLGRETRQARSSRMGGPWCLIHIGIDNTLGASNVCIVHMAFYGTVCAVRTATYVDLKITLDALGVKTLGSSISQLLAPAWQMAHTDDITLPELPVAGRQKSGYVASFRDPRVAQLPGTNFCCGGTGLPAVVFSGFMQRARWTWQFETEYVARVALYLMYSGRAAEGFRLVKVTSGQALTSELPRSSPNIDGTACGCAASPDLPAPTNPGQEDSMSIVPTSSAPSTLLSVHMFKSFKMFQPGADGSGTTLPRLAACQWVGAVRPGTGVLVIEFSLEPTLGVCHFNHVANGCVAAPPPQSKTPSAIPLQVDTIPFACLHSDMFAVLTKAVHASDTFLATHASTFDCVSQRARLSCDGCGVVAGASLHMKTSVWSGPWQTRAVENKIAESMNVEVPFQPVELLWRASWSSTLFASFIHEEDYSSGGTRASMYKLAAQLNGEATAVHPPSASGDLQAANQVLFTLLCGSIMASTSCQVLFDVSESLFLRLYHARHQWPHEISTLTMPCNSLSPLASGGPLSGRRCYVRVLFGDCLLLIMVSDTPPTDATGFLLQFLVCRRRDVAGLIPVGIQGDAPAKQPAAPERRDADLKSAEERTAGRYQKHLRTQHERNWVVAVFSAMRMGIAVPAAACQVALSRCVSASVPLEATLLYSQAEQALRSPPRPGFVSPYAMSDPGAMFDAQFASLILQSFAPVPGTDFFVYTGPCTELADDEVDSANGAATAPVTLEPHHTLCSPSVTEQDGYTDGAGTGVTQGELRAAEDTCPLFLRLVLRVHSVTGARTGDAFRSPRERPTKPQVLPLYDSLWQALTMSVNSLDDSAGVTVPETPVLSPVSSAASSVHEDEETSARAADDTEVAGGAVADATKPRLQSSFSSMVSQDAQSSSKVDGPAVLEKAEPRYRASLEIMGAFLPASQALEPWTMEWQLQRLAKFKRDMAALFASRVLELLLRRPTIKDEDGELIEELLQSLPSTMRTTEYLALSFLHADVGMRMFVGHLEKSPFLRIQRLGALNLVLTSLGPDADPASSLPECWILLRIADAGVEIMLHHPLGSWIHKQRVQLLDVVRTGICETAKRVNQMMLLSQLHETHMASSMLVPPGPGDPVDADDRAAEVASDGPLHPKRDGALSRAITVRANAGTGFTSGQFACSLLHTIRLPLHERLAASSVCRALASSALSMFVVHNRTNVFVYREETGNVVYMRLSVAERLLGAATNIVGTSDVLLEMFGVQEVAPQVVNGLARLLENTLLALTLAFVSTLLARNPMFKLTRGDLMFIQPPLTQPAGCAGWSLPHAMHDPDLFMVMLRQHLSLYLYQLNVVANVDDASVDGVTEPVPPTAFGSALRVNRLCMYYNDIASKNPMAASVIKRVGKGLALVYLTLHRVRCGVQAGADDARPWEAARLRTAEMEGAALNGTGTFSTDVMTVPDLEGPTMMVLVVKIWTRSTEQMKAQQLLRRLGLSIRQTLLDYAMETDVLDARKWEQPFADQPAGLRAAAVNRSNRALYMGAVLHTPTVRQITLHQAIPASSLRSVAREVAHCVNRVNANVHPTMWHRSSAASGVLLQVDWQSEAAGTPESWGIQRLMEAAPDRLIIVGGIAELPQESPSTRRPTSGSLTNVSLTTRSPREGEPEVGDAQMFAFISAADRPKFPTAANDQMVSKHVTMKDIHSDAPSGVDVAPSGPDTTAVAYHRHCSVILSVSTHGVEGWLYNWSPSFADSLGTRLVRTMSWIRCRVHLLNCILLHKCSLSSIVSPACATISAPMRSDAISSSASRTRYLLRDYGRPSAPTVTKSRGKPVVLTMDNISQFVSYAVPTAMEASASRQSSSMSRETKPPVAPGPRRQPSQSGGPANAQSAAMQALAAGRHRASGARTFGPSSLTVATKSPASPASDDGALASPTYHASSDAGGERARGGVLGDALTAAVLARIDVQLSVDTSDPIRRHGRQLTAADAALQPWRNRLDRLRAVTSADATHPCHIDDVRAVMAAGRIMASQRIPFCPRHMTSSVNRRDDKVEELVSEFLVAWRSTIAHSLSAQTIAEASGPEPPVGSDRKVATAADITRSIYMKLVVFKHLVLVELRISPRMAIVTMSVTELELSVNEALLCERAVLPVSGRPVPIPLPQFTKNLRLASSLYSFCVTHLSKYVSRMPTTPSGRLLPITPLLSVSKWSLSGLSYYMSAFSRAPSGCSVQLQQLRVDLPASHSAVSVTAEEVLTYISSKDSLYHVKSMRSLGDVSSFLVESEDGQFPSGGGISGIRFVLFVGVHPYGGHTQEPAIHGEIMPHQLQCFVIRTTALPAANANAPAKKPKIVQPINMDEAVKHAAHFVKQLCTSAMKTCLRDKLWSQLMTPLKAAPQLPALPVARGGVSGSVTVSPSLAKTATVAGARTASTIGTGAGLAAAAAGAAAAFTNVTGAGAGSAAAGSAASTAPPVALIPTHTVAYAGNQVPIATGSTAGAILVTPRYKRAGLHETSSQQPVPASVLAPALFATVQDTPGISDDEYGVLLTLSCRRPLHSVEPRLREFAQMDVAWHRVLQHLIKVFDTNVRIVHHGDNVQVLFLDPDCPDFFVQVSWREAHDVVAFSAVRKDPIDKLGIADRRLVSRLVNSICYWLLCAMQATL